MKLFFRLMMVAFITSLAFTATPNTKDNNKHRYHKKRPRSSTSSMALEKKYTPVKKNYIVPQKSKKILGQKCNRSY